nr:MAG TPA: hypothetical protein [Caudoviricetes sp.]
MVILSHSDNSNILQEVKPFNVDILELCILILLLS